VRHPLRVLIELHRRQNGADTFADLDHRQFLLHQAKGDVVENAQVRKYGVVQTPCPRCACWRRD
jgi:hypothetical protein